MKFMYYTLMQFNEPCIGTTCFDRFSWHLIDVCFLVQCPFCVDLICSSVSESSDYWINAKFYNICVSFSKCLCTSYCVPQKM